MFKRVDRRRRRKEAEERLGLDEDEREVFGLHDTDSSESDSASSESASASSSSSAASSDGHGTQSRNKRKRGASPSPSDERRDDEDGERATDDEEAIDHPTLTIGSALREPVRLIRPHPEAWVCAFCPGKVLKHASMVKVHEASRIHRRRFKHVQELAMEFSPDDDIQSVLAAISTAEAQRKADGATSSRRAEERKAKQAKLKERRKKIKAKKALSIAKAQEKKAIRTAEANAEHPSHEDEATKPSKRLEISSNDSPGGLKNVQRTSPPSIGRRPRKNRRKFS